MSNNGHVIEQLRGMLNAGLDELIKSDEPFTSQTADMVLAKFDRAACKVLVAAAGGGSVETPVPKTEMTRGQKIAASRKRNKARKAKEAETAGPAS